MIKEIGKIQLYQVLIWILFSLVKKDLFDARDELTDASFTISFVGEHTLQYLNIFIDFVPNNGSSGVSPIHLPTVSRGDSIIFSAVIENSGSSPVAFKSSTYNRGRHAHQKVRLIEVGKIIVPAEDSLKVKFMLYTDNLLDEYSGTFDFESNEDLRRYHRISIPFDGRPISEGYPSIKFDSLVLNKYINKGDQCEFNFCFENNEDTPLFIQNAKTSCGCLMASWPERANFGRRMNC